MRDKQIKVIYYSFYGSAGKEFILTWKKLLSLGFSAFVILTLLISGGIALFTDYFHNQRIASLSTTNKHLKAELSTLGQTVASLEEKMALLEKENDDLRVFADLPRLDSDTRQVGTGGAVAAPDDLTTPEPAFLKEYPSESERVREKLDQLERRIALFSDERMEIEKKLNEKRRELKHHPSIRPVFGGRVSDRYGFRIDPFTDVKRHHDGLDISVPHGTDVKATASGTVIKARKTYIPKKGFGKEVVIDHGNGIQTRYAHLSKVLVKVGQKVDRWHVIGKVGDTGRSTGPHLHYEVIIKGKSVDPENYILEY